MRLLAALLFVPVLLAQQPQEPIPSAADLKQRYDEAWRAWGKQNAAARAAGDQQEVERLLPLRAELVFAPKFAAAAAAFAGKEEAVPYLVWLVQAGPLEAAKAAMATLMETHVQSPGVRLAVARLGGRKGEFGVERSRRWLDHVLAQNRDPHVLAQARYTRAAMHVGTRATSTSDELRAIAIADLRAAQELLATVPAADARSLLGLVANLLDEAQRLEPGLPAPEIEGQDLDGVAFQLSDYRGKVVLLDFWGDW